MNNNNFFNNSKSNDNNTLLNSQKTIIYFLCIYFGYRIFYQILGKINNNSFNDNNEIIYFSISSILLLFFLIIKQPVFNFNTQFFYSLCLSIFLTLLYCFTKNKIDNQNKQDKENLVNKSSQITNVITLFLFIFLVLFILLISLLNGSKDDKIQILLGITVVAIVYAALVLIRDKSNTIINFNLGILTYLSCFLYIKNLNISNNKIKDLYDLSFNVLFFSTFAIFSFSGVEYFIKNKSNLNCNQQNKCKSLLGIDKTNIDNNNNNNNNTNQTIIRNVLISFTVLICVFVTIVSYMYFYISKKNKN